MIRENAVGGVVGVDVVVVTVVVVVVLDGNVDDVVKCESILPSTSPLKQADIAHRKMKKACKKYAREEKKQLTMLK